MSKSKKKINVWDHNFASDPGVREAVKTSIINKIEMVRNDRQELEEEWMRFYNMWNVQHDDAHKYQGYAKLYIPEVRKNIEAQARQLTDMAFPEEDFLFCSPGKTGTQKGAEIQLAIRKWQIQQAGLKNKMFVFNRQQCMLGTSPAFVCWDKKVEHAFASMRDPKTGKLKPSRKLVEIYNGPDFRVRDLFKWYSLNAKKFDFTEDGTLEYEVLNQEDLRLLSKAGHLWNIDDLLNGGQDNAYNMSELEKDIRRAEDMGLQITSQGYAGEATLVPENQGTAREGTFLCATVYAKIVCPEACLEDEDPELPIPMKIQIYNNQHIGSVRRNPFWHQKPPYVVGRYIYPNADEFYGQGIPKATQYQQYELNSKAEQAMDSATLALNPIAFIDPALAAQNAQFEVEPGAQWLVNPNGVKLASLPDVSATGYAAMAQMRAQIQDFSDRQPSLPSQLSGKSRTATQAEMVGNIMSVDFKQFQRQNEGDVLQKVMEQWESLTDQNADENQIIMILGRDAMNWKRSVVSKDMYLGDYRYFWHVGADGGSKAIKARQMIDAMKVAGSLPPEAQAKLGFDFAEAYRILWKDIMQLPHSEKVIPDPFALPRQDAEIVLKMIKMGFEAECLPGDDDIQFIRIFGQALGVEKDQETKAELARQIILHQQQLEKKKQLIQQQLLQKQQMAEMMAAQAQQGSSKRKPGSGTQGSGNRTQLSPNASVGDMGSGTRA